MIAQLNGLVARTEANSVIVDVSGVGYRVFVPISLLSSLPETGQKMLLYTTMVVREDDMSLYGFRTLDDQKIFILVTGVTGVGPRVALSMLGMMDPAELARAISANDVKALTRIPGMGPKLAQRVCLELGERMAEFAMMLKVDTFSRFDSAHKAVYEDIIEALVNLGYSRPDARKTADRVVNEDPDSANAPAMIRKALNLLSSGGKR